MSEIRVVLVTAPSQEEGERLARSLVSERLAACGNVIPRVESVYWWEGEVQQDSEVLLILKTTAGRVDTLVRRVKDLHSYDVPEALALPVREGLEEYMDWVAKECMGDSTEG